MLQILILCFPLKGEMDGEGRDKVFHGGGGGGGFRGDGGGSAEKRL